MQPAKTKVLSHRVLHNHFEHENSKPLSDVLASFRLEFSKKNMKTSSLVGKNNCKSLFTI